MKNSDCKQVAPYILIISSLQGFHVDKPEEGLRTGTFSTRVKVTI
jgi:hypothetical protein